MSILIVYYDRSKRRTSLILKGIQSSATVGNFVNIFTHNTNCIINLLLLPRSAIAHVKYTTHIAPVKQQLIYIPQKQALPVPQKASQA